jgi:hypothetical protein
VKDYCSHFKIDLDETKYNGIVSFYFKNGDVVEEIDLEDDPLAF